jgi:predicted Fe-Mo cluster-binding NifX family protein
MRLCIPTLDDRGLAAGVSPHFGSAPFFTVVDTDSGRCEPVVNHHSLHQPGRCDAAQELIPLQVDAVVCSGLGRRALGRLADLGLEVFLTPARDVASALEVYRSGVLEPMTDELACHHQRRACE